MFSDAAGVATARVPTIGVLGVPCYIYIIV